MKLRKSRSPGIPADSTIRWVIDEYGEMVGMIGTVGDLMAAKLVSIKSGGCPADCHQERWLAVPTSYGEEIQEKATREEVLGIFKEKYGKKG